MNNKLFFAALASLSVFSCVLIYGIKQQDKEFYERKIAQTSKLTNVDTMHLLRIRVLENGTISYITTKQEIANLYHENDTIWANLSLHCIDDIDTTAMKAVIIK